MALGNSERRTRWVLPAFAVAVLICGCGGGSDKPPEQAAQEPKIVQAGAPGEPSRSLTEEEAAELPTTPHTRADVDFMLGMIHHHAQALLMTGLVGERSARKDIQLLARRTEISQAAEIETMERWLIARKQKPPDAEDHRNGHGPGSALMPGMVGEAAMGRLAVADGREFDRMFLRYMTRHHRGALTMVDELVATDSGAEPEIGAFTRHVQADQEIEIDRMQDLLGRLKGQPDRSAPRLARLSQEAEERAALSADAGGAPLICDLG